MSELLRAALAYAAHGLYVFPVAPPQAGDTESGKRPVGHLVPNGKDDATRDPATITRWWSAGEWNIGIATAPSGLVVLDVDVGMRKDGTAKQGMSSLAKISAELTDTFTVRTGSGGWHAYYRRPNGLELPQKLAFDDGLDLIGKGYVVAPPSRHYTGGMYTVHVNMPLAPLPSVLCNVQRATKVITLEDVGAPIIEGNRNNAMFRLGATIRNAGVTKDGLLALMRAENAARFKPPLPDSELLMVADSIMLRAEVQRDVAFGAVVDETFNAMFPTEAAKLPNAATASELVSSMREKAKLPKVHLEFEKLDKKLGGLPMHSITVLIAGTGKGKTSLALQVASRHARTQGPTIYYVGEMTRELILARAVGQMLKRSWLDVIEDRIPPEDIERVLNMLPLYFVARSDNPMASIADACSRAQTDGHKGTPMIVVDYIQLLAPVGSDMRIATIQAIRDLQHFVERAPVVALVLSQSSRGGANKIRNASVQDQSEDLGDTGAETAELENGATNQLVLSYKSKDDAEMHEVALVITKSRFGGGSKLGFKFHGPTGVWQEMDRLPLDDEHTAVCAEILGALVVHEGKKCLGDMGTCGHSVTIKYMTEKNSAHRVSGGKEKLKAAVDDLVARKKVRRDEAGHLTLVQ